MKISTFFYVLRQGFANIRRNILFSLASLGTIISCLFLFGIIYAVVVNFQSGMQELEKTVTISVFFDEDASDETIQLIGEQIRTVDLWVPRLCIICIRGHITMVMYSLIFT